MLSRTRPRNYYTDLLMNDFQQVNLSSSAVNLTILAEFKIFSALNYKLNDQIKQENYCKRLRGPQGRNVTPKKSVLAKLREARSCNIKRTD